MTYNAKYKNLDIYSLGEYSKNRNLRKNTLKFIQFYIANNPKRKKGKIFETILSSFKSMNTSSIEKEFSPSSKFSKEPNTSKFQKKYTVSYNINSPKKIGNNLDQKQYLIIYDRIKNAMIYMKKQNSKKRSKMRVLANKLTSYIHGNKNNVENNVSKKPIKSLFSINKQSKKDLSKNDESLSECENNLFEKNNPKVLESFMNSNNNNEDKKDEEEEKNE